MRYGHFDDERREYVIERPDTPLPWINYLGTEEYFGIISNTAGGYSFYRDARLRRSLLDRAARRTDRLASRQAGQQSRRDQRLRAPHDCG